MNQYGYSEISSLSFKKIDKRNYSKLLHWLEDQELIQIRRSDKGIESFSGTKKLYTQTGKDKFTITDIIINEAFCKGYRVNPDLIECSRISLEDQQESGTSPFERLSEISSKKKIEINDKKINSNPILSNLRGGNSSPVAEWNYETSWNSLIIIRTEELSESEYAAYSIGLKKKYSFKSGRYYGTFHNMKKEHTQYLRLFGEKIFEWGDGTAFFAKLIGKLIEDVDYIPYDEKRKWQQFAINDPYIFLMKKLYLRDRETAKTFLNAYVNSTNKSAARMFDIDRYFQKEFPYIRKWLRSIKVVNGKKQLWKLNQYKENEIMSKLCAGLHEEYGVFPITKHDAVYLRESDIETLKKNHVDFNFEVKKCLDYRYYNDTMFDL